MAFTSMENPGMWLHLILSWNRAQVEAAETGFPSGSGAVTVTDPLSRTRQLAANTPIADSIA
jgi:hypothetical protein